MQAIGQLSVLATPTVLDGPSTVVHDAAVTFYNSNNANETVVIQVKVAGVTLTLLSIVLAAGESMILSGLQLDGASSLSAYATDANKVNWFVDQSDGRPLLQVFDANGILKVQQNSGYALSTFAVQGGSSVATILEEGTLYRVAYLAAGAVSPGATGADNVLAAFTLPANFFDGIVQRGLFIQAVGSFANNGHTKECKLIFNPTTAVVGSTVGSGGIVIADTGASTTSGGVGWGLQAQVYKVGAPNSDTQYAQELETVVGAAHGGMGVPVYPTADEDAAILIAVTGNATTTATDILLNQFSVTGMN